MPIEPLVKIKSNNNLIEVDPWTLKILDFERVEVQGECSSLDIYRVIKQLKDEPSAHTWRKIYDFNESNASQRLIEFEESRRPTKFFFYYGIKSNGSRSLIGTGTVAQKISLDFPFEGFPVIARCLIAPQYRNNRLYEPILKHRFRYCQDNYGSRLKGIHLGSQSQRIFSVIKKNVLSIPFVYIGNEELDVGGHLEIVRDYLFVEENFKADILKEVSNLQPFLKSSELLNILNDLFENKFTPRSYFKLQAYLDNEGLDKKQIKLSLPSFFEILSLFEAIGVICSNEDENIVHQPTNNRKGA